jgi:hypothetical protein
VFKYNGNIEKIQIAISSANSDKIRSHIINLIAKQEKFDMCDCDSMDLAEKFDIFLHNISIEVEVYYPFNRFTSAIGYFTPEKPKTIHVNGYKLKSMTVRNLVSNFFHEAGHVFDNLSSCHCHHGSNSPSGKQNTFQYSLNRFVDSFFGENSYIQQPTRLPWYKRLIRFIF